MYEPIAVTNRIKKLRDTYLNSPVGSAPGSVSDDGNRAFYYSYDRWQSLYFLQGWEKYRKEPTTTLRRAKAEAYLLLNMKPVIDDGELIVGQLDFASYTEENEKELSERNDAFVSNAPNIDGEGRCCHTALDLEKLLKVGVNGLIEEIKAELDKLDFSDNNSFGENIEKEDFYLGCIVELEALLCYAKKYSEYALFLSKNADAKRAIELTEISEILKNVPAKPAKTFREALQSIHFYTFPLFGLYAFGRPDRYLFEFYQRDIESGIITKEEAQELIDNFCMLCSTYVFSRSAISLMVGGKDSCGKPVENELTYMFLTAIEHLNMALPGIALCINSDTSEKLLEYAVSFIAKGYAHPALYNDDVISESLQKYGVPQSDSHNYVNTTCAEISVIGKTNAWTTCPVINMAKLFYDSLHNGKKLTSIEDVIDNYIEVLKVDVIEGNKRMARLQAERERNGAEPLRVSCLIDGCIKKGKGISRGGAVYNWVMPDFVGFGNVVDSVSAINELVFKNQELTMEKFIEILDNNYEGHELLRNRIIFDTAHYGNEDPFCDSTADYIANAIIQICERLTTYRNSKVIPGMFSYILHSSHGKRAPATPDGRFNGDILSDSCGPVQGRDTNGPTAMLNSVSSWNNKAFLGGIILNMKFAKNIMKKISAICTLIKVFFEKGGVQIQINCVDNEILKDAILHPENHGNLIVRVGGYSAYFTKLPRRLQNEIIERNTYDV